VCFVPWWLKSVPDHRGHSTSLDDPCDSRRSAEWWARFLGFMRPEITIEQHVATHAKHSIPRASAFAEDLSSREANRRATIADDEWGDRHLQSIELIRLEEHRHGDTAALYEDPGATAAVQQTNQRLDIDGFFSKGAFANPIPSWDSDDPSSPESTFVRVGQWLRAHIQRFGFAVVEHAMMVPEPAIGIEDDAQRIRTRDETRGQLWIVGGHRARSDDHGVAERAQTMEMQDVFLAGDPARFACMRRDEPVEALTEVANGDGPGLSRAANRQIEIDHRVARIVSRQEGLPARAGTPREERSRIVERHGLQLPAISDCEDGKLIQCSQPVGVASRRLNDPPREISFSFALNLCSRQACLVVHHPCRLYRSSGSARQSCENVAGSPSRLCRTQAREQLSFVQPGS
jgi:hypothetical protein